MPQKVLEKCIKEAEFFKNLWKDNINYTENVLKYNEEIKI